MVTGITIFLVSKPWLKCVYKLTRTSPHTQSSGTFLYSFWNNLFVLFSFICCLLIYLLNCITCTCRINACFNNV
uniref:Uncharacterized protein n=1 Tax=Pararge aegeria TaxID=116150 RepID=S4PQM2_9NEOP